MERAILGKLRETSTAAKAVTKRVPLCPMESVAPAHMRSPFWLGRCPGNRITGGKAHHHGTRHVRNRAATAYGMTVTSLWRSKTSLGAKFKRLPAHFESAHTLARLVYRMLKYGQG